MVSGRVRVWMVTLVLTAASLTVLGCGSPTPADPVTPVATDGSAGVLDGASLVDSICTTCHTRERIDAASKDLAQWQETINRMITQHGAKVSSEQQSAIAIYLSNR